jgi:hypothetical protein
VGTLKKLLVDDGRRDIGQQLPRVTGSWLDFTPLTGSFSEVSVAGITLVAEKSFQR